MANYANLITLVNDAIKTNGKQAITGRRLQTVLGEIIGSLGTGYQFIGIATPATNPGTPDQNVCYLASTVGTYTNFGGLVLADGEIAILKYNGTWSKDSTGAASLEMVNQLGQEIEDIRDYGILTKYITSGNVWSSQSSFNSRYIKVKPGDTIRIVKNSTKNAYCAFIESPNTSINPPVFKNGFTGTNRSITDSTFTVNEDCYFWWNCVYSQSEDYSPSVLTLNGVDIRTQTYAYNRFDDLEDRIEDVEDAVADIQQDIQTMAGDIDTVEEAVATQSETLQTLVGTYTPAGQQALAWGEVVSGKYWNLVDGVAGMVSASGYYARPTLYPVNLGRKITVTVDNTIISDGEATAAFSCYDNDGNPVLADGTVARRNWAGADSYVNNGDGTTTYIFTIPANCTQIGFYYKTSEITFYINTPESFNYSEDLDEHIEYVAGGGVTTSADSAKYYLKGASPKSFPNTKKIAILCAGQSNAEGRVPYADMPAEIKSAQPIANCHYVEDSESGAFASLNITGQWAFDLVTYYNLCVTANKEIYVMKWAAGGTSIDPLGDGTYHWTADYEDLSSPGYSLLRKFENEIRNHIASDGENFAIRAMLWHQGEGDRGSLGTGSDDRYYENLRNMVSYIRGIVGDERLPFITGTISHNSAQYDAKIEAAQQRLASEDPYFCLIDMSGAPLLDSYHFDDDSSVYFGQMAYNALIDYGVLSATKLTPVRPW